MNSHRMRLKVALCALLMALSLPSPAQRTIDLQGHRGARGLLAENTLPSFALALQMGVTTLELDVVVTQDDVLVISHDPALNPDITRDAQGRFLSNKGPDIRQLTFERLQSYDVGRIKPTSRYAQTFSAQKDLDGVRIPRLKDLFELVKAQGHTQVKFAIETKITPQRPDQTPDPERFVQLLLKEIKEHSMSERVQILSFDWRTLQAVQKTAPGMPTVYITAQLAALDNLGIKAGQPSAWTAGFQHAQHGSVPKMIKAAGGTHWSSFWRELDAQKVREAQSLGLKVLAWTVNDRETMGQMLDLGVDGLVTDRPDIAIELLKARGLRW
ncbi:glycerophosphodiester phosphodiesterase [Limnohabitans sp. 2KL-51]|uniref:glycerophosphodiester phosphodiesterase n=1 Tax=Limnohabitans sp. 2KL-51 TaxID=1977911 RepID=UPI001E610182|nr:glycerophosphodiester phosphodiesterase [Limnohabitans sp. 2KL-51]